MSNFRPVSAERCLAKESQLTFKTAVSYYCGADYAVTEAMYDSVRLIDHIPALTDYPVCISLQRSPHNHQLAKKQNLRTSRCRSVLVTAAEVIG